MKREGLWLVAIVVLVALSVVALAINKPKYGLDIKGGVRAVLEAHPTPEQVASKSYSQQVVAKILEQRLNISGVGETTVQPKGDTMFIVEIPDTKDKDVVIQRLGTAAQMNFYYFSDVQDPTSGKNMTAPYQWDERQRVFTDVQTHQQFHDEAGVADLFQTLLANSDPHPGATPYTVPPALQQIAPSGRILYFTPDQAKQADELNQELTNYNALIASCGPPIVTGADINPDAQARFSTTGANGAEPVVDFTLTATGTTKFGNFTSAHVGELLAMVLDGKVLSAPNVNSPIEDGSVEISGGFANLSEAKSLADFLNAGALPVPLTIDQNETVEATLGQGSLQKMIHAGEVGMALVILFMLSYYLLPGLVASVALLIYTMFALAVFNGGLSLFIPQVTLSLPGIAGFILSVGMAVDANILIFERLKEELRNGKALRQAIDAGFRRAFSAIRDSNACTIITCLILYSMGTPTVQGFALTLGIGVAISLFTAITVTRTLLYLLVDAGAEKHPEWFGLKRQWFARHNADGTVATQADMAGAANVDIVKRRYWFYGLSLLIIVPGLIFMTPATLKIGGVTLHGVGGLKPSIEFRGGTQVEVDFKGRVVTQDAIKNALKQNSSPRVPDMNEALVQMGNNGTLAIISIPDRGVNDYRFIASGTNGITHSGTLDDPKPAMDNLGVPYQLTAHSLVGGTISKELTQDAFEAVLVASILIVLYLSFAFSISGFVAGLRFGVSAIIALLHDVLVLLGSFAILGYFLNWQIDSLFITATLTVVGFSVHDTIVIFDRLRENLRHRLRGESFEALANRSILQSFARSVNTSFTVILTLLSMMILGEPSTRLLIVALIIGIISGTYSSIFNATSILVDWEMWLASRGTGMTPPQAALPTDEDWSAARRPEPATAGTSGNGAARPGGRSARPKRGGATRRF